MKIASVAVRMTACVISRQPLSGVAHSGFPIAKKKTNADAAEIVASTFIEV